jgi:hypothetical protein
MQTGRIAFITPSVYNAIKLDSSFSGKQANDAFNEIFKNGQVGEVDGVAIIKVPSTYMPYHTDLILVHPSATVAPWKLETYKIHEDAPGISGWLIEGRFITDAFVLTAKTSAVAIHSTSPSS